MREAKEDGAAEGLKAALRGPGGRMCLHLRADENSCYCQFKMGPSRVVARVVWFRQRMPNDKLDKWPVWSSIEAGKGVDEARVAVDDLDGADFEKALAF